MRKLLLNGLIILSTTLCMAQKNKIDKEIKKLENVEQAENYIKKRASKKNKIIVFNAVKEQTGLAKKLFKLPKGGTVKQDSEFHKTYYKVLKKIKTPHHRVSYIYMNGKQADLTKINTYREQIIAKYNNNTPFGNLAKKHSMSRNARQGGDSGWFAESEKNTAFEKIIINDTHKVNDIFTVDIPSESSYYIVLKTHVKKVIPEIQVLKIVEPKKR